MIGCEAAIFYLMLGLVFSRGVGLGTGIGIGTKNWVMKGVVLS